MTHREVALLAALGPVLAACPVADAECFGNDECAAEQRCVARACVPRAADAGPRDGGPVVVRDAGAPDAGDAGAPCPPRDRATFGRALDDGQSALGDAILLHFDAPSPPLADRSGARLEARCSTPACPAREACGIYDAAYAFDGADDALEIAGPLDFGIAGAQFGLEAWVRVDPTTTATMCLFDYEDGATAGIELAVFPDGAVGKVGDPSVRSPATSLRDGAWHHVSMVREPDTSVTLAVDRAIVAQGVFDSTVVEAATSITIGACADGRPLAGALDELRFTTANPQRETDTSIARPDVVVAWEQGGAIHVGDERLVTTRVVADEGASPALSGDGASVAYLVCDPLCAIHEQALATGADAILTTTATVVPGRIAYLDASHLFYLAGAPCAATVRRYDLALDVDVAITDPGPWTHVESGLRATNASGAALFLAGADCGGGSEVVARVDDPGEVTAPTAPVVIYSVDSATSRITDVTAAPTWDPFATEAVYVQVEPDGEVTDSVTRVLSTDGAPLGVVAFDATGFGLGTRRAPHPRYFYAATSFAAPFDEARLELVLVDAELGRTQRLTDDAAPSRRPAVWFRLY